MYGGAKDASRAKRFRDTPTKQPMFTSAGVEWRSTSQCSLQEEIAVSPFYLDFLL
jgi:hypothetical protein